MEMDMELVKRTMVKDFECNQNAKTQMERPV